MKKRVQIFPIVDELAIWECPCCGERRGLLAGSRGGGTAGLHCRRCSVEIAISYSATEVTVTAFAPDGKHGTEGFGVKEKKLLLAIGEALGFLIVMTSPVDGHVDRIKGLRKAIQNIQEESE